MDTPASWDLIAERETAATTTVQGPRGQIAALTGQLARAESDLADLATTRKTLLGLTGEPDATSPAAATLASVAHQQILAVFTTATAAMRAKDVCLALSLGTAPKDTEGPPAKLKRLTTRQIHVETEPGPFSLAPATPSTQDADQQTQLSTKPKTDGTPRTTLSDNADRSTARIRCTEPGEISRPVRTRCRQRRARQRYRQRAQRRRVPA